MQDSMPASSPLPSPATRKPFRLHRERQATKRRVTIGLDFGTSSTKVVVNIEEQTADTDKFLIIPHDSAAAQMSVLCPSTIAVQGTTLLIGHEAERIPGALRSFKMCVPCLDPDHRSSQCPRCLSSQRGFFLLNGKPISVVDVCTLYLASVFARIRTRLREHFEDDAITIHVNSAAPLDQIQNKADLRGPFEVALFRAWKLSERVQEPWTISAAMTQLRKVSSLEVPSDAESPTCIIPETHAAMTAYILAPGRANGLYAAADIGAGTTDVSFFWCGRENGIRTAYYYATKSAFIGIDDLDRALQSLIGGDSGDLRHRREAMGDSDLAKWADWLQPTINSIYQQYKATFGQAYQNSGGERTWLETVRQMRRAKYTLCLVGGGARLSCVDQAMRMPLNNLRFDEVRVEVPELPENLRILLPAGRSADPPEYCAEQLPLLLLAYGLAHRTVDIPEWAEHVHVDRPIQYRPEITHEEIYG